jgi:hypothetical protein
MDDTARALRDLEHSSTRNAEKICIAIDQLTEALEELIDVIADIERDNNVLDETE